jgi:pilus assembly protein Flp/PilA
VILVPRRRRKRGSRSREYTITLVVFSKLVRDESGATAIEYGLIAALISVVIIAAVSLVGTNLQTTFSSVAAAL